MDEKSKLKAMKVGTSQWKKITKRKGHSKINEQIKRNLYAWITRHPQVVQSLISNDCLKVMLDDQTEPQLVPKLLVKRHSDFLALGLLTGVDVIDTL